MQLALPIHCRSLRRCSSDLQEHQPRTPQVSCGTHALVSGLPGHHNDQQVAPTAAARPIVLMGLLLITVGFIDHPISQEHPLNIFHQAKCSQRQMYSKSTGQKIAPAEPPAPPKARREGAVGVSWLYWTGKRSVDARPSCSLRTSDDISGLPVGCGTSASSANASSRCSSRFSSDVSIRSSPAHCIR